MSDGLPEGWVASRLGDVAELVSGAGFPLALQNRRDGQYPFFKVGNLGEVESGGALTTSEHTVDAATASQLKARILPPGSILFAKIGMAIRLNRRRILARHGCIDNNMMAAVPGPNVDPRFLQRFLETVDMMPLAQATTVPSLRKSILKALPIPLPPLAEQVRIAGQVQRLLAEVNTARRRLTRVPEILKRFRQSVLAAACSGRLATGQREQDCAIDDARRLAAGLQVRPPGGQEDGPEGWPMAALEDVLQPGGLFDGPFGSNLKTSDYTDCGVRVVRLENLANLRFVDDKRTYISQTKYELLKKHTVQEGDILFGSFVDDAVRVCVMPRHSGTAIAKADCFCIRPDPDLMDPHFLVLQLARSTTRDALVSEIHGATRPRVTTKQVRGLTVLVPPLGVQRAIVKEAAVYLGAADLVEASLKAARATLDKLPQAILVKALQGGRLAL